ncbi:MFS general substrate transporter, partial [Exidia glandulosa HHB12029]
MADSVDDKPMVTESSKSLTKHKLDATVEVQYTTRELGHGDLQVVEYKLYKRRWLGLAAIVLFNVCVSSNGQFFGPISVQAAEDFNVTLTQMNWLSNAVNLAYLPASFLTSWILARVGIRKTLLLGGVHLLVATSLRVAATAPRLSTGGAYTLLLIAQLFVALAQPCVQIIAVKYSEVWFDLRGRITSTMFMSIANPLGGVVGSLVLPALPTTNWAIYVGVIMAAVLFPIGFVVQDHPPTPPTFSGSKQSPPLRDTLRAWIGKIDVESVSYMEPRDRVDFLI